jgi:LPXTG-motif cell wall-anchored protein
METSQERKKEFMKHFKKMMALIIAFVMVVGTLSMMSFAATADSSVTISGLDNGDKVSLYQILKWDEDSATGWVFIEPFDDLLDETGTSPFATKLTNPTDAERYDEVLGMITDNISFEEANVIASLAKTATKADTLTAANNKVTYNITTGKEGLYMAVIGAVDPEASYLPVFVSADFESKNDTNAIDASTAKHVPASEAAVAKKAKNHVEKTTEDITSSVNTAIDSKVGMEVDFYVDTQIPVFMETSFSPQFDINDKITKGIELVSKSIEVTLGEGSTATTYIYPYTDAVFTLTENGTDSYTVVFDADYLKSNKAPVKVHIAYKGTVTNKAEFNVNEDSNDVTVTYKNGPDGAASALRDATNHYTFSLGAEAFGFDGERGSTYELIKVSADKNGKNIYEPINISTWESPIQRHALAGAKFQLFTDSACKVPYSNGIYTSEAVFTTDSTGIISFSGLEAGTYYLLEMDAPDGYIKSSTPVRIDIEAEYKDVTVPAESKNGVHYAAYSVKVLDKYTVKVNNAAVYNGTSYTYSSDSVVNTYTFVDESAHITEMDPELTNVSDGDIINTPGVELPSTGGIGTTIFYVIGAILVIGAGILLVTRRRMTEE